MRHQRLCFCFKFYSTPTLQSTEESKRLFCSFFLRESMPNPKADITIDPAKLNSVDTVPLGHQA